MKGNISVNNNPKNISINKQKRTIIIIIAVSIVFIAVYFAIASIDFKKLLGDNKSNNSSLNIYFYDESLSKNIFQDEKYMELNRTITFSKTAWGTSETLLDDDDAITAGPAANLLYHMTGYILTGNHEAYNECFSDYYYNNGGEAQGRFTQQKIYNITITEVSVTDKIDSEGTPYKEYYYKLEYMIRHNNGSLRNDMGSDCIKTQHIILSDRSSEEILIDEIYTVDTVIK